MILEKTKKNKVSLRAHDGSGCMRRQTDAKEVTAEVKVSRNGPERRFGKKAASHRIRLRLTIRLMANGSLHTSSVGRIRVNFLGFDRLTAYLKLF